MATTPLSQAIMKGLDPGIYQPIQQMETGDALTQAGMDSSPTSKWGALGRLAQSLAGAYLGNSSRSELANTIAGGKRQAMEDLMASIQRPAAVPSAAPQSAAPRPLPQAAAAQPQPAVQPQAAPAAFDPATFADLAKKQADRVDEPAVPFGAAPPEQAAAPAAPAPAAAGGPDYGSAIAKIESGGRYDLLGPVTKSGDRAYGKYQVMGANIPDWTQAHLGKRMTPQEFLASPEAQDAVFKGQFGQYAQKYGPEGAAKAWFAGEHGMKNPNAKDQLGTTVQSYADQFMSGLGGQPGPQAIEAAASGHPVQVAQAAPAPAAEANSGLDAHRLLAVLNNPYADDTAKALAGKLLLQQLTPKEDEFASSPSGIFNKRTGELKQGQQGANGQYGDLQGRDLLATVQQNEPGLAARATAIIEGRAPYPTSSRVNSEDNRLKELVTRIDPTFETGNSGARIKVRNEFLAGGPNTPAGQITAGNTAIQHLATLAKASKAIGGVNNAWIATGPLNKANATIEGLKNDPNLVEYNNALGRFAEEATKFYRGIGGNESDIQRAISDLGPGQSPEAREAAIKAQAELMHGKINSLQDRWKQGMGPLVDEFPIIQPKSKAAMDVINGVKGAGEPAADASHPAATEAPAKVSTKEEYDALPAGKTYVAPDGSIRTKK